MLTIRPTQIAVFEQQVENHFIAELAEHLCVRNVSVLTRFPEQVRHTIVAIMIARGRRWKLSWKSSLALYADLMQTVAPNFDQHPTVNEYLTGAEAADEALLSIADELPRNVWQEAEQHRVELYLYTPPELDQTPLRSRTQVALSVALWDHAEEADALGQTVARAERAAVRLGFADEIDAPLVLAAARVLYGPQFPVATEVLPWVKDVVNRRRSPRLRLELLRLRLALDFGRRV